MARSTTSTQHGRNIIWTGGQGSALKLAGFSREKLHLICDFDMTLSKYYISSESSASLRHYRHCNSSQQKFVRNLTTHLMFSYCDELSQINPSLDMSEYRDKQESLLSKYYPIEIDTSLSLQDKIPLMVEWWAKSHDLILSLGLTRSLLSRLILFPSFDDEDDNSTDLALKKAQCKIEMRSGLELLDGFCRVNGVPMLTFSAGIYGILPSFRSRSSYFEDVIEEIFKHYNLFQGDLFHIHSNRMLFDITDRLIGFTDPIIHSFNKSESLLFNESSSMSKEESLDADRFRRVLKERNQVILIGDSLSDIQMAPVPPYTRDNVFSIGLLNTFHFVETGNGSVRFQRVADSSFVSDGDSNLALKQQEEELLGKELLKKYSACFDLVVCGDLGFDDFLPEVLSHIR